MAEPRIVGYAERDQPLPDANSPDPATAKSFRSSNSSASSRAAKRIKRHPDPSTPIGNAVNISKPTNPSKESLRSIARDSRIPLADLASTQGSCPLTPKNQKISKNPGYQELHMPKSGGAGRLKENERAPPILDSDEESFSGGDIFTSTDQQQLSAQRRRLSRHGYDETTTEF